MEASLLISALEDALAGAPAARGFARWDRVVPEPWCAWLLVCLARQLPRQQWLVRVVEERLPDRDEEEGEVPGLPGWRYEFHGRGCLLAREGEQLDVDFHGDGGLTIDPYFFAHRVLSLADPPLPEARLRALLPTADLMARRIRALYPAALAVPREPSDHVFRVAPALEALADRLAAADFEDPAVREAFRVHLGDFEAAASAGAQRAATARRAYLEFLFSLLESGDDAHLALVPLRQLLSPQDLVDACTRVLRAPIGRSTGPTLELLAERPDLPFCAAVEDVLDRLSPEVDHPYAMCGAARYLLARGAARERALAGLFAFAAVEKVKGYVGNPMLDELALLAIEHAPDRALPLVRRALRSEVPMVRWQMRAALGAIGEPWCRREMEEVRAEGGGDEEEEEGG